MPLHWDKSVFNGVFGELAPLPLFPRSFWPQNLNLRSFHLGGGGGAGG